MSHAGCPGSDSARGHCAGRNSPACRRGRRDDGSCRPVTTGRMRNLPAAGSVQATRDGAGDASGMTPANREPGVVESRAATPTHRCRAGGHRRVTMRAPHGKRPGHYACDDPTPGRATRSTRGTNNGCGRPGDPGIRCPVSGRWAAHRTLSSGVATPDHSRGDRMTTTSIERTLPPAGEMYRALVERDSRYDGIFFTAVRTTGIFCRPTCPARKPERRNVEFFASARDALAHGFRPCLRCRPMDLPGVTPEPIQRLLDEIERAPMNRLRDADLRARGLDPATLRRWFRTHHGMTFQAYHRALRLSRALGQLAGGADITHAAFDNGYDSLSGFQDALRQITGRSPGRSRDTVAVHLSRVLTPLGPMLLGTTAEQVCILEFTDRRMLETQLTRLSRRLGCAFVPGSTDVGRSMEQELGEYFEGTR